MPRFTYLLWKLGKTFSLVRPIVDLILVNKDGSFPNGQEWGCYFEYLNYLFYGIVGFLIWYFIAGPILQGWFWTRTRAAYVTWWGAVMLEYDARTAKIEFYDEQMLVGIRNSFHARDLEQSKNINYVAQGANQKSIGDDISSAPDRVEIWVDGKPSDHRGRHSRISRFSRINPAQAVELSRMEMEIERLKKSIVFNVRVLADHVGNDVIVVDDTPSKHSQRNRIWKVVTSVARMTYIFTPSYIDHVSSHEERTRYLSPPPEMGDESRR